ncbi:hypothetical protein KJ684_03485, partial [Patescibacteria group bacterium]|nr:hypothetical protein [Patescibacteria group bacterium]
IVVNSSNWDVSSTGVASGLTGLTSSGTITLSGLTADRLVATTTGGQLTNTITSANVINSVSDETGSGLLVFATSPQFTTSMTTAGIFAINPGGALTIGDNGDTLYLNSSDWDISTTGAMTGISGITTDGGYTQSGTTANTFTGTSTFSNATYSALFTGGNVGIGTASPLYKLAVDGTASISGAFYTDSTAVIGGNLTVSGTGTHSIAGTLDPTNVAAFTLFGAITGNSQDITGITEFGSVRASISDSLSITDNINVTNDGYFGGNIGIGTTSPDYTLEVDGTASISGNLLVNGAITSSTGSSSVYDLTINNDLKVLGDTNLNLVTLSQLTVTGQADFQGNVLDTTGTLTLADDVEITGTTGLNLTGSGAGITFTGDNNHIISATSGTLQLGATTLLGTITGNSQNITGIGYLTIDNLRLDGNTLDTTSGNLTLDSTGGITLINDILNVGSGVFYVDPSTNRVGIGTTSLDTTFEVDGNASVSGNLILGGIQQTGGTTSSSFSGIVDFAGVPIGTNTSEGSVYINPSTAGVNNTLLGISVGDIQKLRFDAEGDLEILGILTSTGTGTSQLSGNLQVDGNTILGNAVSDTITVTGRFNTSLVPSADITYNIGSEDLRWNSFYVTSMSVENLYAGGVASTSFVINSENATADTEDSQLEFERGTSTPNAILKWNATDDRFEFNDFPLYLTNRLIVAGTSTSSFAGIANFTATPTGTDVNQGSVYINPSSGAANYTLFSVAVSGNERFKVDAEGDTTVQGSLGVENQIYDITQDTLTINDDLQINGNDIKDSGSITRLTLGNTTT